MTNSTETLRFVVPVEIRISEHRSGEDIRYDASVHLGGLMLMGSCNGHYATKEAACENARSTAREWAKRNGGVETEAMAEMTI